MRGLPIIQHTLSAIALAATIPMLLAIADASSVPASAQVYMADPSGQPSTARSLGTLPANEIPAQPPAMPPQAMPPEGSMIQQGTTDEVIVQPVKAGNVTYITGGIGDEERDALKAVRQDYNLWIMSSSSTGEFLGDIQINITNAHGDVVLDAPAGPIFYASLPAGSYSVQATSQGHAKKQRVTVGKKGAPLHFTW